ncbi:MAG: ketoacyl-ACP synthase III, partial [Bacteroidales bacterium]|nr:ketoacyl-ACP synthase III [Bacteroidales bacterium]
MKHTLHSIIAASGRYIPGRKVTNEDFLGHTFHESTGSIIEKENQEIIDKFEKITEIAERRYADSDEVTSDLATKAALDAIVSSGTDKEDLDYIIV